MLPGSSCQCPCSLDHTFPGGVSAAGLDLLVNGVFGFNFGLLRLFVFGASCQCPCSLDHTFPGGTAPLGFELLDRGLWFSKGFGDTGVVWIEFVYAV